MYIIDAILLTKIPLAQFQILSYFYRLALPTGALILAPLGKRKELAAVLDSHKITDYKLEIKKADFELKNIGKVISAEPILTQQQIKLALWLGQYYFASPGLFLKMMTPRQRQLPTTNSQLPTEKNQKLIIVPTISQTGKFIQKFKKAAVWHSEISKKQRNEIWWKVKNGEAQTIIGTRSAVFLPFQNLKEIIIEDEINPAHRSWDMFPHYRVHEVAKKLTDLFEARLTLEGTVSVEFSDVLHRQISGDVARPKIKTSLIDMRQELKEGNFSIFGRALQKSISEALAQKKQIILFINRRGAANFVLCRDCGYVAKCQNCDAPLAHHLISQKPVMFCHRCGYKENPPGLCPQCQSHRIKAVGVGTQKVELEAQKIFSGAKIMRLDSDTAPNAKDQQKIIEAFVKKEANILIATQIIFSWTDKIASAAPALAAVISADTLLHLPDFRSGERTFQAITLLKNLLRPNGQFIIQTYNPESSVIKYAAQSDWQSFYQEEIETRQTLGYPPFSQIVKLTFRHKNPQKAGQEAKILAAKLKLANKNKEVEISDALPAFVPKEKGRYVWNIIIKLTPRGVIPRNEATRDPAENQKQYLTFGSSEFLLRRNSLLQYVPSNWEIDVDPSDLL